MDENGLAIMLFGIATVFCIVYAVYQSVDLIKYKDKINYTKAIIIDTVTVAPETMKIRNWIVNSKLNNFFKGIDFILIW